MEALHEKSSTSMRRGIVHGGKVLAPMLGSELIRPGGACSYAEVCDRTKRGWARKHGIGWQAGKSGTLKTSLSALLMVVDDQLETLV